MADSEENNNLSKIFMSSKIRTSKGKTKIVPNTAQNMYINQEDLKIGLTSKSKKTISQNMISQNQINQNGGKKLSKSANIKQILSKDMGKISELDIEADSISESESDIESDSEVEAETEEIGEIEEIDPNEDPTDEYEKNGSEISDTELSEKDSDDELEPEIEVEYNEDGEHEKETENVDDDEECLYEYDDLIDERDTEKPSIEVAKNERTTDPQMTHYERVRLLGIRAKQIAMGSKVMVKYNGNLGAVELAKYELNNKTTPLIIKRPLPNNSYELWKVSELEFNDDDKSNLLNDINDTFILSYAIKV